MKLVDIPLFEKANPVLAVSVLLYKTSTINQVEDKNPNVDKVHRSKAEGRPIYLLLIEEEDNFHNLAVTNFDRLLNYHKDNTRIRSRWCTICLHGFSLQAAFDKHTALCDKNVARTTLYSMPKEKYVYYSDWSKTITVKNLRQ